MTGAACLWCAIAIILLVIGVCFLIPFFIFMADDGYKAASPLAVPMTVCLVLAFVSGIFCQQSYDINFAVATKNIQYNVVVEKNVDIQMDYQDVTGQNKQGANNEK